MSLYSQLFLFSFWVGYIVFVQFGLYCCQLPDFSTDNFSSSWVKNYLAKECANLQLEKEKLFFMGQ